MKQSRLTDEQMVTILREAGFCRNKSAMGGLLRMGEVIFGLVG